MNRLPFKRLAVLAGLLALGLALGGCSKCGWGLESSLGACKIDRTHS